MKHSLRPFLPALLLAFGSLSLLTMSPGCATTGEPLARVIVKAQGENQFLVDNRWVELDRLPGALKRAGAGAETEIIVEMAAGASPASLQLVYPTLQRAGYKKVFLSHPREATATVKPVSTPPPAPASPAGRTLSPTGPQRRK